VLIDLTTPDIRDLGLRVLRVWSPDLLTLCLPSAPPLAHPRFGDYGGVGEEKPHPYP
jgi:ribosomal protein S12 methylthiotransferase accessory factor